MRITIFIGILFWALLYTALAPIALIIQIGSWSMKTIDDQWSRTK